jgi:hypothetical protein
MTVTAAPPPRRQQSARKAMCNSSPKRSWTCTGLTYTMRNLGTRRLMSSTASSTSRAHRNCRPPSSDTGGVDHATPSAPSSEMADNQVPIGGTRRRVASAVGCCVALHGGHRVGRACCPRRLCRAGASQNRKRLVLQTAILLIKLIVLIAGLKSYWAVFRLAAQLA